MLLYQLGARFTISIFAYNLQTNMFLGTLQTSEKIKRLWAITTMFFYAILINKNDTFDIGTRIDSVKKL